MQNTLHYKPVRTEYKLGETSCPYNFKVFGSLSEYHSNASQRFLKENSGILSTRATF